MKPEELTAEQKVKTMEEKKISIEQGKKVSGGVQKPVPPILQPTPQPVPTPPSFPFPFPLPIPDSESTKPSPNPEVPSVEEIKKAIEEQLEKIGK